MTRPLTGRCGKIFGKRHSPRRTSPFPRQEHLTRRNEVSPRQLAAATSGLDTIAKPLHLFSAPPPVCSSGFGHKTYGSFKVTSGYSHSGSGQKTFGSVRVMSGYSHSGSKDLRVRQGNVRVFSLRLRPKDLRIRKGI